MAHTDVNITWGAPNPARGSLVETYCTIAVTNVDEIDSFFDEQEPSLGEHDEPTSEGPLELTDAPPPVVADRYERQRPLGSGGMGEVWRVLDRRLHRTVALKVIRSRLVAETLLARFQEEAQVTAQLQHPGIIPVHDYGQLDDGRVWFTMKEVQGRTLESLLQEVHRAWRLGMEATESGFTFRRMLEGFLRVCETMAYSHSRGVVHRDLKPSNIMLGPFGEVLVLDWGLAKLVGESPDSVSVDAYEMSSGEQRETAIGSITGTPAYMSPEQARGESHLAGPEADVYSLGATLYDLLCERPPRLAQTPRELVLQVSLGTEFPSPRQVAEGPEIDDELERICLKALETEEPDRYPDAGAMAADLAQWLDDARKREHAMAFVDASKEKVQAGALAADQAKEKRAAAEAALVGVAENAPVSEKLAGWGLEDEAVALEEAARTARTEAVQDLRAALSHAPDFVLAHDLLADHFRGQHAALEEAGKEAEARQVAKELALHDRSRRYGGYLTGTGALTLVTDPEGVEVRLHRYELVERRLQPKLVMSLGPTPLIEVPLEMGSYLLTLHKPGHEVVRYPVCVERQEHWHGVAPGESEPMPVHIPLLGAIPGGEVYVPAGWFWRGDDGSFASLDRFERHWGLGFCVGRDPVTVGEYAAWLNQLLAAGREEEAIQRQPRVPDSEEPILLRDAQGRFGGMRSDRPGWEANPTSLRVPIVMVPPSDALAYAASLGARLPTNDEWLHGGRGADRRIYPWGDAFDPTWCRMRTTSSTLRIVEVDEHQEDVSPYGMRGAAGNVSDWATDDSSSDATWRRGGFVAQGPNSCRLAYGFRENRPDAKYTTNSFRVARSFGNR